MQGPPFGRTRLGRRYGRSLRAPDLSIATLFARFRATGAAVRRLYRHLDVSARSAWAEGRGGGRTRLPVTWGSRFRPAASWLSVARSRVVRDTQCATPDMAAMATAALVTSRTQWRTRAHTPSPSRPSSPYSSGIMIRPRRLGQDLSRCLTIRLLHRASQDGRPPRQDARRNSADESQSCAHFVFADGPPRLSPPSWRPAGSLWSAR